MDEFNFDDYLNFINLVVVHMNELQQDYFSNDFQIEYWNNIQVKLQKNILKLK